MSGNKQDLEEIEIDKFAEEYNIDFNADVVGVLTREMYNANRDIANTFIIGSNKGPTPEEIKKSKIDHGYNALYNN